MNNIFEKLTNQMTAAIESAVSLAMHSKNSEVMPLHVLWSLCTNTNSILNQVFNKMSIDKSAIELEIKSEIEKLSKSSHVSKENIKLSKAMVESLHVAEGLMSKQGDSYLAVDTWIVANLESFKKILSKYIDILELKKTLKL